MNPSGFYVDPVKVSPSVISDYSDYYAFQVLFHLLLKGPWICTWHTSQKRYILLHLKQIKKL